MLGFRKMTQPAVWCQLLPTRWTHSLTLAAHLALVNTQHLHSLACMPFMRLLHPPQLLHLTLLILLSLPFLLHKIILLLILLLLCTGLQVLLHQEDGNMSRADYHQLVVPPLLTSATCQALSLVLLPCLVLLIHMVNQLILTQTANLCVRIPFAPPAYPQLPPS